MENLIAISKSKHKNWGFKPLKNYSHLRNQSACQITFLELKQTCGFMVLFFHKNRSDSFNLCSLNGIFKDSNLFINENNDWIGPYIPAVYRSLPFYITTSTQGQDPIVCFDSSLNCVSEINTDENFVPFFKENDEVSSKFKETINFINVLQKDLERTNNIIIDLNKAGLITEWDLIVKSDDNDDNENHPIKGLYKIDEEKLLNLSDKNVCKLFHSKAIELAYYQLYSMENIKKLAALQQLVISQKTNTKNSMAPAALNTREKAIEKQKMAEKEELDSLVKNLMSDD